MNYKKDTIKTNYLNIVQRIVNTADKCGRDLGKIKLITVTKAHSTEVAEFAINAGAKNLGENYPLEAIEKIASLKEYGDVSWHMIGHVQSRKAKIVAEQFDYLHSLDNVKLAKKLVNQLISLNKKMSVLLEVNVSGEESKFGWDVLSEKGKEDFYTDVKALIELNQIEIRGLMTMPPFSSDPEESRPYFKKMKSLLKCLKVDFPEVQWQELSMGTSVDFETAIEEGATFVRVGTAIVGERDYSKKYMR